MGPGLTWLSYRVRIMYEIADGVWQLPLIPRHSVNAYLSPSTSSLAAESTQTSSRRRSDQANVSHQASPSSEGISLPIA
jgi:hypothetical protein